MSKQEETITVALTRKEVAWLTLGMMLRSEIDMSKVPGTLQENYDAYLWGKKTLEIDDQEE